MRTFEYKFKIDDLTVELNPIQVFPDDMNLEEVFFIIERHIKKGITSARKHFEEK